MVLFPKLVKSLGAVALSTVFLISFSGTAWADMPPHGRPGNLKPLPGVSIGVAAGVGDEATQQHVFFEGKFSHKLLVFAEVDRATSQIDDLAVNGDLDVEFSGATYGLYYQLPKIRAFHLTLAIRQQSGDGEDDSVIVSGASRVNFLEERRATEIAVLLEQENWARGSWQPYVGIGFRVTDTDIGISTSGGRDITSNELTENTAQFTAGLHYQRNRISWFLEANAGSGDDFPWRLQSGLRFGFFHRSPSGR